MKRIALFLTVVLCQNASSALTLLLDTNNKTFSFEGSLTGLGAGGQDVRLNFHRVGSPTSTPTGGSTQILSSSRSIYTVSDSQLGRRYGGFDFLLNASSPAGSNSSTIQVSFAYHDAYSTRRDGSITISGTGYSHSYRGLDLSAQQLLEDAVGSRLLNYSRFGLFGTNENFITIGEVPEPELPPTPPSTNTNDTSGDGGRVPEPNSFFLLVFGATVVWLRRKRRL